ncbi:MAG: hypothetical protein WAW37_20945 [Syntrophobacteraceae bacterium]
MRRSTVLFALTFAAIVFFLASSAYAVSGKLFVEGRLTTAAGAYLASGAYSVTFRIYSSETAATPLWVDTFPKVTVGASGMFHVALGSHKALPVSLLYPEKPAPPYRVTVVGSNTKWLEVEVAGEVFGPRIKINPSSYAGNADTLDGNDWKFFSPATHTHDTRYYTEAQADSLLGGKAPVSHSHDDLYYSKSAVDAKVAALKSTNDSQQTQINALKSKNDSHQTQIDALKSTNNSQQNQINSLQSKNDSQQSQINALQAQVSQLVSLLEGVSRADDASGNPTVTFSGVNVRIVNGSGSTGGTVNGRGNLIIGYNESRTSGGAVNDRSGSHNLSIGTENNFSSYGGMVAGRTNSISGAYSSVSGGHGNTAGGDGSSVSGGWQNTAGGMYSSVSGGAFSTAGGNESSVSGGRNNSAGGAYSSVSGGEFNKAGYLSSSVSGGSDRSAGGDRDWVAGSYWSDL